MDSNACYVFSASEATLVKIYAVNVGTAEAPAWNKSYITYIEVKVVNTVTNVLNFAELENYPKGTYTDGAVQEYDDVFTFYHGKDSRVDESSKTFDDGFEATKRFSFGGKFKKVDGAPGRALEIKASGKGTVTVWWVSGGDGRSVDLLDSGFAVIETTGTESVVADALYITTFEIPAEGVYYLVNAVNNNHWFKVEVTTEG